MSIFDDERKRLGLPAMSEASSISDFFKKERERVQKGEKTRFQEVKDLEVDNQRFAGRAQIDDSKFYKTKEKDKKPSANTVSSDEERDGILGFLDRWVLPISKGATDFLVPGNTETMARNNPDNPVVKAAQRDRGLETDILNSIGMIGATIAPYSQGYKAANLALGRLGALSKVTNPYAQKALTGGVAGGLTEAGLSGLNEWTNPDAYNMKDYALRTGLGVAGGAILDPALYGVGRGLTKGIESATSKAMKGLLPDESSLTKSLTDNIVSTRAERVPIGDFPNMSNTPKVGQLNELLPKASDVANPSYTKPLNTFTTPKMDIEVPQVGKSLDEALQAKIEPINQPIQQPTTAPKTIDKKPDERSFFSTVGKSEKTSDEFLQRLESFDKSYTPMSNKETVDYANAYIEKDIEKAYQFVKNASKFDPRHITVGHRLIDEFQAKGEFDRALDVVERLAEQGTKAGQSIQSFSIYNRLSPQGQLLRAQRIVNKINEAVVSPDKKVKLSDDMVAQISGTADSLQKLTGQQELGKDVLSVVEKWKKGETPTDSEVDMVKSFFADAKKFVSDLDPKAPPAKPKKIKDVRSRDKVVDFMSKREEIAKQELKKIMSRANALPVDAFYHLSVIGASKIAKGTVKIADFTEQMVKEFGEEIRPYIKQIYNKAVETFNLQSTSMTGKRLSEVEKIVNKATKDKVLDPEDAANIQKYLNDYLSLTGDARLEASLELQATLQLLERPTFAQKISTFQTIMQLLNPKTTVRNALGNELFYRVEQINKLVATPIDIARSKINNNQRTVTFKTNNQGRYWKYWMMGLKAGWRGLNPAGLQTAYDLGPQAFRSKWNPATYLEKSLGATLRSFDYAGYMRAYNKTLGEVATLQAMNEGLKGKALKDAVKQYIAQADENMIQIADSYGKYATFQDNTAISNALTKTKRGLNKVSTLGMTDEFGLGDLILKYPKTPGNLIMRALEYSPAGFVRSSYLLRDAFKTKNPFDSREAVLGFTRAITGTAGFSLLGYTLADKGILTSSGNSDYEVASLEREAGKQPNSVNVTALKRFISSGFDLDEAETRENDLFVSYDWAQPISMAIALGTGVNQSMDEQEKLNPLDATKAAADSAANTIIEQSVLSGLNDFLASYPGRTMSDRVTDTLKGAASSFVPTFANQLRQANDNTSRTTYAPSFTEEMKNKAINRVPSLEKVLPKAYTTLGEPRETFQDGSNNAFNVFLNPSFVKRYNPSPEAKFVLDFINETGEKTVAPRSAKKYLMVDGERYDLTGEQYSEMQRIMGEETMKGFERVVPNLQGETDFEKIKKALEKVLNNAGEKARKELKQQVGE